MLVENIAYKKLIDTVKINKDKEILNKVVYITELIQSAEKCKRYLTLGSDDAVKLYVNGRLIKCVHKRRGVDPDIGQDLLEVNLNKGGNVFLYKIGQGNGAWGLYRKFIDTKKELIEFKKHNINCYLFNDVLIDDTCKYINFNTKYIQDNSFRFKFNWRKFDEIEHIYQSYEINGDSLTTKIKLPNKFDGFSLLTMSVYDDHGLFFSDNIPIIKKHIADSLIQNLLYRKEKPNNPTEVSRKLAITNYYDITTKKRIRKDGICVSSRVLNDAIFGLFQYYNNKHIYYPGPRNMGYYDIEADQVVPYKMFLPTQLDITKNSIPHLVFCLPWKLEINRFYNLKGINGFETFHKLQWQERSEKNNIITITFPDKAVNTPESNIAKSRNKQIKQIINDLKQKLNCDSFCVSFITISNGSPIAFKQLEELEGIEIKSFGIVVGVR